MKGNAAGVYYALLVRIDGDLATEAEIYLDAIDFDAATPWLPNADAVAFINAAPHSGVVVHASGEQGDIQNLPGDREGSLEIGNWYRLELGDSGYPSDWADNDDLTTDGRHTYIVRLDTIPFDVSSTLSALHSIAPGSPPAPHWIPAIRSPQSWWLATMNMGQGSCVAVMSPNTNRPVAYIDAGFPTMPYSRTAPENQLFAANDPEFVNARETAVKRIL